jgi:hypothetical protein
MRLQGLLVQAHVPNLQLSKLLAFDAHSSTLTISHH